MPCASVYWTLVLLRLSSLSESVAHRSEKFFIVEWLDEESHRADLHRRRAGRQIVTRRDDNNPREKDSSISFCDFTVLAWTTRRDGLRRETLRRRKV